MKYLKVTGTIATLTVGVALLFTAPPKASADDDRGRCQHRVEKARDHYRHETQEHGKHSRQAEEAKAKLNQAWDRCWSETHSWYDPDRREWRTDRDWDRNYDWDHDRDHDHD